MDFSWLLEKLDIVAVVIGFNFLMMGLHSILGWMKDKTATDVDNKADDMIVKILDFLKKMVDVASANKEH